MQRLYQRRLPQDELLTIDFAQRVGAIAHEIRPLPVNVYINRRGQVIRVAVGNALDTQIPLLELPRQGAERLSGLRCVTSQTDADEPGQTTLLAMALQRLDALIILNVTGEGFTSRRGAATGYVQSARLAHLVADRERRWWVSDSKPLRQMVERDFAALVETLESEFRRAFTAREVDLERDRVVLVGLLLPDQTLEALEERLAEIELLVDSAGGQVLQTLWQKRPSPHAKTVIGSGKVRELALMVQDVGANMVVCDRELTPSQVRTLEDRVGARVVDRTEVILDIFAQRARSRAGKLQVELAQLEYLLPRLTGRGQTMSRLGGGIGTRGPGETKLEMERRAIQRRISLLQQQVNQLQAHRQRLRQRRQQRDVPAVAIVGYTNAGKSTLLNALTAADAYAADQLFATLDPTTRRLQLEANMPLLLTDTVGFLTDLPPQLVDAFRATLEEVTEADALLHVVDLSHPNWEHQIAAVDRLLDDMTFATGPRQLVFNKIDCVGDTTLAHVQKHYPRALFVSARDRSNFDLLLAALQRFARADRLQPALTRV
ncbi:MAG: GTPase HflX [Cyanobacteria bacterium P01_E01_bin.48]